MAPWPGFEPGSGGRQPPILDRTILPGLFDNEDLFFDFKFFLFSFGSMLEGFWSMLDPNKFLAYWRFCLQYSNFPLAIQCLIRPYFISFLINF